VHAYTHMCLHTYMRCLHCNKLHQHTTTHCNKLHQHTTTHCNTRSSKITAEGRSHASLPTLQHTATHCNTLQHTATHCNTLQHTATHCNICRQPLEGELPLHRPRLPRLRLRHLFQHQPCHLGPKVVRRRPFRCCSVLQCALSVLECAGSVLLQSVLLQSVLLQSVLLQSVSVPFGLQHREISSHMHSSARRVPVAAWCSVLRRVAVSPNSRRAAERVCCSALQCVAVCCSVL